MHGVLRPFSPRALTKESWLPSPCYQYTQGCLAPFLLEKCKASVQIWVGGCPLSDQPLGTTSGGNLILSLLKYSHPALPGRHICPPFSLGPQKTDTHCCVKSKQDKSGQELNVAN